MAKEKKDLSRLKNLNKEYKPIENHLETVIADFKEAGYSCKWGYYCGHYIKDGKEWARESFPIPVVTVDNICDVGFDIYSTFIETRLSRASALRFDFSSLLDYSLEVYGVENFLEDFYNPKLDVSFIHKRITLSREEEVGIGLSFSYLEGSARLLEIIGILKSCGTYIVKADEPTPERKAFNKLLGVSEEEKE